MFTGIIQHVGVVRAVEGGQGGARLTIDLGPLGQGLREGDSVAVNGACLTVAALGEAAAKFDVVAETLRLTTLGELRGGARVNLERALAVGGALDGHMVQGHVDGVAMVGKVRRGDEWLVECTAGRDLTNLMVTKGSVAVDGVSLTLVSVGSDRFGVALIPTTLRATTLGDLRVGRRVNIETDVIGKYVLRHLRLLAGAEGGGGLEAGVTIDRLREAGFA